MTFHDRDARCGDDAGQVSAFLIVITAAIAACLGLVLDGGTMLIDKTRAITLAQEAARAGGQHLDMNALVTPGASKLVLQRAEATAAAQDHLTAAGATGTVTVTGDSVHVVARVPYTTTILPLSGMAEAEATASTITP